MNLEERTVQTALYSNNPVRALIKENLRRVWPVSLVLFLILLCTLVIPAYVEKIDGYFSYFSVSTHPVLVFIQVAFPIITACAVYRYMHTVSGTALIHSLPLNRRSLFTGSFLSGLILTLAPVILIFLLILPLYDFGPYPGWNHMLNEDFLYSVSQDGPYALDWLFAFGLTLLVLFFMSALSALSASLTGNGISLMGITLVLNFIVFFIYLIVTGYLDTFLIGFSNMSQAQEEIIPLLNPLFFSVAMPYSFDYSFLGSLVFVIVYLGISCALVLAAYKLYKRKKLENAGRPLSFRFAEILITYLITLVCMAGMGIAFYFQNSGYGYYASSGIDYALSIASLIIGSLIGAVLAFMVVTMLMQKTPRIFTKKTFKSFGIFCIVGAVFISSTVFDLTGYTNRVPVPGQVRTAELTFTAYPFMLPYKDLRSYELVNDMTARAETNEEILALTDFHRGMIAHEKAYRTSSSGRSEFSSWRGSASFVYDMYGPFRMYRTYDMHSNYSTMELREALATMTCFREGMTLERLVGYENIAGFSVVDATGFSSKYKQEELKLFDAEMIALAKCMDNDFRSLSAAELAGKTPDISLMFSIEVRYPKSGNLRGYNTYEINYVVTPSYTETLAWMDKEHGTELGKSNIDTPS